MPLTIDDETDGFLLVNAKSAGTEALVPVSIDLYEAQSRRVALFDEYNSDPEKIELAFREWLYTKGVPAVSLATCERIALAIVAGIEEFKKKHGIVWGKPDSPDSTDNPSTPAASPS